MRSAPSCTGQAWRRDVPVLFVVERAQSPTFASSVAPFAALDGRPSTLLTTILPMTLSQWRCRLCGFDRYHRVTVLRKTGVRYETPFSACSQCSVMFLNPAQFDVNSTTNPSVEMPPLVTPIRRRR